MENAFAKRTFLEMTVEKVSNTFKLEKLNCTFHGSFQESKLSCLCEQSYFGNNCEYKYCLNNCNSNGICEANGLCTCNQNFTGFDCSKSKENLSNFRKMFK